MTNLASYLQAHTLDWTRVELRIVRFSNQHAAREAILCLRDDGMALTDVAKQAGVQIESSRPMLRDLDATLRARLLGTAKGDFIGPIADAKHFLIIELCDKVFPSADDPELSALVEQHVANTIGMQFSKEAA